MGFEEYLGIWPEELLGGTDSNNYTNQARKYLSLGPIISYRIRGINRV
jgi:hypothetical protein